MLLLLLIFAGPMDDLGGTLAMFARTEALRLCQKPIAVNVAGFAGTVALHEPTRDLVIDIASIALNDDRFRVQTTITGTFELVGKMKIAETPTEVNARVRVRLGVKGGAVLTFEKGEFIVRPGTEDIELVDVDVIRFEPDLLPGGKVLLAGLVKGLFKTHKSEIAKLVREKIEPISLSRPATLSGPAPPGDNPILRRYAQSVVLSKLSEHDNPRNAIAIEERGDAIVVRGTAWLDNPAKLCRVQITRAELRDGIVHLGGTLQAPIVGTARFDLPGTISAESLFRANMSLAIEGDLRFKEGKPAGCNVYCLGGEVTEFQAGALPVQLVSRPVQTLLNRVLVMKAAEYRVKIEQAGGGPCRDEIITSAYRRALNREPDPAGKKNAVEILSQFSPRDLLRRLIASPEFAESYLKGKSREQATTVVYRIILGREPTATERKYLAGKETVYEERRVRLRMVPVAVGQRARTIDDLTWALLTSKEYQEPFGTGLPR
ncbi:MAG: hypothetical protein EBV06_04335 [Planctomycetia bacterium]|nr:hypothetical protein [Planctomycetia bacterium]